MKKGQLITISAVIIAALIFLVIFSRSANNGSTQQQNETLSCVPASCCHPTSCVDKSQTPDCSGIFCTQECVPGTLDCGQGFCEAVNGKCEVVLK